MKVVNIISHRNYEEQVFSCGDIAKVELDRSDNKSPVNDKIIENKSFPMSGNSLLEIFIQIDGTDYSPFEKESIKRILKAVDRQIKHDPLPKIMGSLGPSLKICVPQAKPFIISLIDKFLVPR